MAFNIVYLLKHIYKLYELNCFQCISTTSLRICLKFTMDNAILEMEKYYYKRFRMFFTCTIYLRILTVDSYEKILIN